MEDLENLLLSNVLKNLNEENSSVSLFAVGQSIRNLERSAGILSAIYVEGLEIISVPVSSQNLERLHGIATPIFSGHGLNKCVDPSMVSGWGIPAPQFLKPKHDYFLDTIIPNLAFDSFQKIIPGFDVTHQGTCKVRLADASLYGPDGHFKSQEFPDTFGDGVFGRMLLIVPVQNGFQGGRFNVERNGLVKQFQFDPNINQVFHTIVFINGCKIELEPITEGWMFLMSFDFSWKTEFSLSIPSLFLPSFLSILVSAEAILQSWNNRTTLKQTNDDSFVSAMTMEAEYHVDNFLFFSLEHRYSTSLCISKLHGRDLLLATLLKSVSSIDIHLATVSGVAASSTRISRCNQNGKKCATCNDCAVCIDNWISMDDSLMQFNGYQLELKACSFMRRVVGDTNLISRLIQKDQEPPTNVLVIQSRRRTIHTECCHRFDVMLDYLESQTLSILSHVCHLKRKKLLDTLIRVIEFCHDYPSLVWRDSTAPRTCRLIQLCLNLKAKQPGLVLLKALATDFLLEGTEKTVQSSIVNEANDVETSSPHTPKMPTLIPEEPDSPDHVACLTIEDSDSDSDLEIIEVSKMPQLESLQNGDGPPVIEVNVNSNPVNSKSTESHPTVQQTISNSVQHSFYEGVRDERVAQMIAEFQCQLGGWADCAPFILRLFTPTRVAQQWLFLMDLIRQLLKRSCHEGAALAANELASSLHAQCNGGRISLNEEQVNSYVNLLIGLEGHVKTSGAYRFYSGAALISRLDPFQQCQLVLSLDEMSEVWAIPTCRRFLLETCQNLLQSDLHAYTSISSLVVRLVNCYLKLEQQDLFKALIVKICQGPAVKSFLEPILASNVLSEQLELLKIIASTSSGRALLIHSVHSRMIPLKHRTLQEMDLAEDLYSIILFAYCVKEVIGPSNNVEELEPTLNLLVRLSNESIYRVSGQFLDLFKTNLPKRQLAYQALMKLSQAALERNATATFDDQLIDFFVELAQLFLHQSDLWFSNLLRLLKEVNSLSILDVFKNLLIHLEIWGHAKPQSIFELLMKCWLSKLIKMLDSNSEIRRSILNQNLGISKVVCVFIGSEKKLTDLQFNLDTIFKGFIVLFGYMSFKQLASLVLDICGHLTHIDLDLKSLPISLRLYQHLCDSVVSANFDSVILTEGVLFMSMMKVFLWLDNVPLLINLCEKISSVSRPDSDVPVVPAIVSCTELLQLFVGISKIYSSVNKAFCMLLNQRIGFLKMVATTNRELMAARNQGQQQPARLTNNAIQTELKSLTGLLNLVGEGENLPTEAPVPSDIPVPSDVTVPADVPADIPVLLDVSVRPSARIEFQMTAVIETWIADICIRLAYHEVCRVSDSSAPKRLYYLTDQLDDDIAKCVEEFFLGEKEHSHPVQFGCDLFSPLLEKLSDWRLCQLCAKMYTNSCQQQSSSLRDIPSCFSLCRFIGETLVKKDVGRLLQSSSDAVAYIVAGVMNFFFWLSDSSSVSWAQQICRARSVHQENPYVSKVVVSPQARKMAAAGEWNRKAFCLLLDQKINRLKTIKSQLERIDKTSAVASTLASSRDDLMKNLQEMSALRASLNSMSELEEENPSSLEGSRRTFDDTHCTPSSKRVRVVDCL